MSSKTLNESTNAAEDAPVAKKARTTNDNNKSPFDVKLDAVKAECAKQDCGYMIITGMGGLDGEEYEEANETEKKRIQANLTQADVDKFRIVMIPKSRGNDMDEMEKLVLGDQFGNSIMMFGTQFSYEILCAFETFKRKYQNTKDPKKKFNYIFGFSDCLRSYDAWQHDHEMGWGSEFGGCKMIKSLAHLWKNLLQKYSSQDLGLDAEFSAPGVQAWLEDFKDELESVDMYDEPQLKFNYK